MRGRDGRWSELHRQPVRTGGPEHRDGAPMELRGQLLQALHAGTQARVTVRYGGAQADPERPTYTRELTFGPFATERTGAVDLEPMR